MSNCIWWIRRDLRLIDNQALKAALSSGKNVVPVFILDSHLIHSAPKRLAFLWDGLHHLEAELSNHGSGLVVRQGDPLQELARLVNETSADWIFAEEDFSPYSLRRDKAVSEKLPLVTVAGATVHHPTAVTKPDGTAYKVFTPFSRRWHALPLPARGLQSLPAQFLPAHRPDSLPLPVIPNRDPVFPAGSTEALLRLEAFTSRAIFDYADNRNRLDKVGTSMLSPYLRFGMLSSRQIAWAGMEAARRAPDETARASCETWLNELVWREFYTNILYAFPRVLHEAFNLKLRVIPWEDDPAGLRAWQQGLTGYPVVDACMRQLQELGWMHNRGRMITASFLVKDLLINWQEGEAWFMQNLIDGDPASNNGGWQWTAGVGTDSAPYFRILNPVSQSKKCDPEGLFIRRWLPELAKVPLAYIHEPWLMPGDIQESVHCRIGKDYPAPIVDHSKVKERTIHAYKGGSSFSAKQSDNINGTSSGL